MEGGKLRGGPRGPWPARLLAAFPTPRVTELGSLPRETRNKEVPLLWGQRTSLGKATSSLKQLTWLLREP